MTLTAMLLVVASTLLHVAWNLRSKRTFASLPAFFVVTALGALIVSPALLFVGPPLSDIPETVWLILPLTGLAQAVYYAGLATAYRDSDVSFAYPVIRSLPVLLVPAVTAWFHLAEPSTPLAWTGFTLITVGVLLMPFHRPRDITPRAYFTPPCFSALCAAAGTTAYSLLDAEALSHLRDAPNWTNTHAAVAYVILQALFSNVWLALVVLTWQPARRAAWDTLRRHAPRAAVTGVMIYVGYALILAAIAYAVNVGYIVAFRQLSVPLTALAGVMLLKESCSLMRIANLTLVTAGLICVAVG